MCPVENVTALQFPIQQSVYGMKTDFVKQIYLEFRIFKTTEHFKLGNFF